MVIRNDVCGRGRRFRAQARRGAARQHEAARAGKKDDVPRLQLITDGIVRAPREKRVFDFVPPPVGDRPQFDAILVGLTEVVDETLPEQCPAKAGPA